MEMTFWSALVLLLIVIDPLGNLPLFTTALRGIPPARQKWIILRECAVALAVLLVFFFFGQRILNLLHLSQTSLGIAGGIVLLLIAVRMIFLKPEEIFGAQPEGEPFIVPLAIPLIAGPAALTTVLILDPAQTSSFNAVLAIFSALLISTIIFLCDTWISRILGEKGLLAMERLLGLILAAISVEMFLRGVREFIHSL